MENAEGAATIDDAVRIDLLDGDMYAGDPGPVYAWLREHAPAYFDEGNGLWGVSRHADISAIERDARLWSSTGGYRPQLPSDPSMIGMDDPEHAERRRLVYRRFTPRHVAEKYTDKVRAVVTELIDVALEKGAVDAVPALAAPLPGRMIGWLLGFPDERWPELVHWSETTIVAGGGLRYVTHDAAVAAGEFATAVLELAAERRRCPHDDLTSLWAGRPDYDDEHLANEALLLLDGGAETTRTVIATTVDALIRHPEQWALLREDPGLMENAIEEFIRWTTPSSTCAAAPPGHGPGRPGDLRGAAGPADVRLRQPRPGGLHRPGRLRRDPARRPPHRLRPRHALLPRRGAGPAGAADLLRGVRPPGRLGRLGRRPGSAHPPQRVRPGRHLVPDRPRTPLTPGEARGNPPASPVPRAPRRDPANPGGVPFPDIAVIPQ
nr:hypothetical protein GCM10020093_045710 [Planobispora longispora]